MAGIRLVLLLGVSLAHNALVVEGGFLKAALGLRIGLSPEEKGWGQPYQHHGGPAVKGQFLSGVQKPGGHGGWGGGGGGHGGGGLLRHLKILGVNLYLGGPKHHHAGGGGGGGGGHHFGGHQGGSHYSKGGWGWGKQGYSSHPQFIPSKQTTGGIDYSTNEITVIGGDDKGPQSQYGYATSLVAGQVFGNPGPNHPFANNPQGKPTQQHVVYVPAASQYPSHYANEVVNEIKFLNGKSNSPVMTMGNEGPRPPTLNGGRGGPSYAPSQGGSHYNGALRGAGPPPQGFSLASLMKGPQWAPKQQPRGMARFLPFFGMRGSGGPPPPPGHPMHSPYRRPGPPQRQPQKQSPQGGQEIPSFSTLYNVKAPNNGQQQQLVAQGTGFHPQQQQQQQQQRGFNGQGGNSPNGDYRPHAFGGFVESSNSIGPAGPGGIPFVPRQVQHASHPSSPTYLQQQSNHPRSHFNTQNSQRNPGFSQQGPSQRGPPPSFSSGGPGGPPPSFSSGGPPPSFSSGGPGGPPNFNSGRPGGPGGPPPNFSSGAPTSFSSGAPGTVVHNFPPQHSQGSPNGHGFPNSQESFTPPAFSPFPTNSAEHGGPSSSSSSSIHPFGSSEHTHHGFPESSPQQGSGGPGFISLASTSAGPVGSNPNFPYISPLSPFASEKQRQFASTQFASGSGSSGNAVEFSPSPNAGGPVEFSPNGPGGVQVYHEQSMGGYEPLPGFAYSHSDTSAVVSMGMTTKNDPPVMMENNAIPTEFKSSEGASSSAESSAPSQQKRRFATSQEQQQEIRLQKRLQGGSSTQIQSPVASSSPTRKVRGGFLNSNMASVASSSQVWSPMEQSSKTQGNKKPERPNRSVENKKMQSRSSSGEQAGGVGDMATSPTELSTATLSKGGSSVEQGSSKNNKIPFTRKRMTTSTTTSATSINTDKPTTTAASSTSSVSSTSTAASG